MPPEIPYSFENFIIGSSNRLAFAGAKAICEQPKDKYNPLFIHGPRGTGKTHLLKAIEYELKTLRPKFDIKYIDLDFFNDLFVHAENDENLKLFRKQMREGDVFIYDNLDHLQKNDASKEEFFHTFNEIFQKGNQLVISSELSTKELENFPERLISRLEWGLTATLSAPAFETRLLFYERAFEKSGLKFEKAAIEELAQKEENSVLRIQKSIKDFLDYVINEKIEFITQELTKNFLSVQKYEKVYEPQEIQLAVARYLNVKPMEMLSASRVAKVVEARHIAIYLIRRLTNHTLKEIGILFGKRHHTTIMHAEEEIKNKLENDKNLNSLINKIIQQISV